MKYFLIYARFFFQYKTLVLNLFISFILQARDLVYELFILHNYNWSSIYFLDHNV